VSLLTSPQNPRLKALRALHARKGRLAAGAFLVETTKLLLEAQASGFPLDEVFATPEWLEAHPGLVAGPVTLVAERAFAAIATTETPDGVLAVAKLPGDRPLPPATGQACYVLADGLQDPGNVGTIVRTADAVAATAVLVGAGSADPFSPKVVRATMGSLFHLPVLGPRDLAPDVRSLQGSGVVVLATALGAERSIYETDLTRPVAWLVGNESAGLTAELRDMADEVVAIPMPGRAESLNAGIATAVCLFETLRQRAIPTNEPSRTPPRTR
jgi:TrmH family RNA methyltransferase